MADEMTVEQRLIKSWREQANAYMKRIRKVQYQDQQHRVEMYNMAQTLRYCANALYRAKWKEANNG